MIPSIETFVVENLYLVIYLEYSADIIIIIFSSLFFATPSRLICQRTGSVQLNVVLTEDKYDEVLKMVCHTNRKLQISCVTSNNQRDKHNLHRSNRGPRSSPHN